jgi:hypothetical protein
LQERSQRGLKGDIIARDLEKMRRDEIPDPKEDILSLNSNASNSNEMNMEALLRELAGAVGGGGFNLGNLGNLR